MIRFVLPLFLLLLFVLEGTIFQVFAPEKYGVSYYFMPHFVTVVIVIIGIYRGKPFGILYGIVFGLAFDAVYTEMLGPYMFTMGLVGYLFSLDYKLIQRNLFFVFVIVLGAVAFLEYFIYGMYFFLQKTNMASEHFFYIRFLPTIGLNGVFTLLIVYPLKKFLFYLQRVEKMRRQ